MPHDIAPDSSQSTAGNQLAQAASAGRAAPIGRVDTLEGTVSVQHVDGTVETLAQGASVYTRDLVTTKAGAKVALVFADKTTFALGESGQMRLDELVYNPVGKDGKIALSMLKGAFAFVSGDIAGTQADAMTVRTPVGTIGIRGTAVTGNVDPGGNSTFSAVPDPNGAHSTVAFTNGAGTQILTENFSITVQTFFTAPSLPFASPGEVLSEIGALTAIAGAIAKTVNPGGSEPPAPKGGPTTQQTPQQGGEAADNHQPLFHVTVTDTGSFDTGGSLGFSISVTFDFQFSLYQSFPIPIQLQIAPPPPPALPPQTGFVGTLGKDTFIGTPGADTFNFSAVHNSLQSGDFVDGRGGADVLTATFDKPFTIDTTLIVTNVPTINLAIHGGGSLDALGITSGSSGPSTITATGDGALTVADLQVNFDGSALTDPLTVTAIAGGLTIVAGQGANQLTGAGFGTGDVLSYAKATGPIDFTYLTKTVLHGGVADTVSGFDGIIGTASSDNINVSLTGGGHHITVEGGGGNNTLTGSLSDSDTLSYVHAPAAVSVNFGTGTASNGFGGTDSFSGFVAAIGSAGNDTFITANSTAMIDGGAGFDVVGIGGTVNNLTLVNVEDVVGLNAAAVSTNLTLAPSGLFSVDLSASGGNDTININGGASGAITLGSGGTDVITQAGGTVAVTALAGGDAITVNTGGGDDLVTLGTGNNSLIVTGGNDTIISTGPNDILSVSGGNATIVALGGDDAISILSGNATIAAFGSADIITVQNGNATIAALGSDDHITLDTGQHFVAISGNADAMTVGGGNDTVSITGGGGDTFTTSAGSETLSVIDGGTQGDSISAGNGNYMLALTGSSDSIFAGSGNDTIGVNGNNDSIIWGAGNGLVSVVGNSDLIQDGAPPVTFGANTITANGGNDTVVVSSGNNVITVIGNSDSIFALNGNNLITVSGNSDAVTAGTGANTVVVGGTSDMISLGAGHNLIVLANGSGSDTVSPGFSSDFNTVVGGLGSNNVLNGGGNATTPGAHDLLDYSHAAPGATIDFTAGAATINGGTDAISGFGQLIATIGGDVITTSDQINFVEGGGGADTLHLGGFSNALTVGHIAALDVLNTNVGANVTATSLDATSVFDFSNASSATLALNIAGTTSVAIGQDMPTVPGADELQLLGSSGGPGVSALVLENGNYHLTFDGTELNGNGMTIDASQMAAGQSLTFDGTAESGSFTVIAGAESGSLAVAQGTGVLDYSHAASPIVLDITSFFDPLPCSSFQTSVSGFSPVSGGTDSFTGFASLIGSPGGELVFTAGVDGSGLTTIDLQNGQLGTSDGNCATAISGFTAVDYQGSANVSIFGSAAGGNFISAGGGDDNIFDNSGSGDTIIAGNGDDFFSLSGNHHSITFGSGNDNLNDSAGGGGNTVIGGNGNDFIFLGGTKNSVTLGSGNDAVTGGGGGETISLGGGNDSVGVSGGGNLINTGGGNATMTGFSGGDTVNVGAGTDQINYVNPTDSFSNAASAADPNTDVINNFRDAGAAASVIDVSALFGGSVQTFAGSRGTQPDFATAFSGDGPNIVDYAIIGGNTFVHATGASGYSATDLLIELAGAHTLTGGIGTGNVHLGSGSPP